MKKCEKVYTKIDINEVLEERYFIKLGDDVFAKIYIKKLIEWKNSKYRKPLILKGARQIGKTYILKQFGAENYEGVAYFNFEHDEDLYNLFSKTKDPKRILEQLAFIYGKAILPEKH